MSNTLNVLLAGFGGQGVLFAGKVLAITGLTDDRQVSWLPSYGPEMRGGTANCSVVLSDEPIGSPNVLKPDVLIAMNQPSFDKFVNEVVPGGVIIADNSLVLEIPEVENVTIHKIPATQLALDNGLKGLANVICLGKLFSVVNICSDETVQAAIEGAVPPSKADKLVLNRKALEIGAAN